MGGATHPGDGLGEAVDLVVMFCAREPSDLEQKVVDPWRLWRKDHMTTFNDAGEEIEPGNLVTFRPDRLDWEIAVLAQRLDQAGPVGAVLDQDRTGTVLFMKGLNTGDELREAACLS